MQGDSGRQTGGIDRNDDYDHNRGPLLRLNRFAGNDINGLVIRADARSNDTTQFNGYQIPNPAPVLSIEDRADKDELLIESVWDDTDIVHVLREGIFLNNYEHEGGLRLQSSPNESLVVKMINGVPISIHFVVQVSRLAAN